MPTRLRLYPYRPETDLRNRISSLASTFASESKKVSDEVLREADALLAKGEESKKRWEESPMGVACRKKYAKQRIAARVAAKEAKICS